MKEALLEKTLRKLRIGRIKNTILSYGERERERARTVPIA